jgi:hypothetical protein
MTPPLTKRVGVEPRGVHVQDMGYRWGSREEGQPGGSGEQGISGLDGSGFEVGSALGPPGVDL